MLSTLCLIAVAGVASVALAAGPSGDGGSTRPKVYFVHGQQLRALPARGRSVPLVLDQLTEGPQAAARRRGIVSFVPRAVRVHSSVRSGSGVVTVDLSKAFAVGATAEGRTARLAQLVYSLSSLVAVTGVRVRVAGRVPAPAAFPRFDLEHPLTKADVARPKLRLPRPQREKRLPPSASVRRLQQRLAALSFLPSLDVDGRPGAETTLAVIAFQKWVGLSRDGVAGPNTLRALAAARRPAPIGARSGKHIEVLIDRQVTLLEDGSRVLLTVPVSTGKGSNATPIGSFRIFRKEVKSWSFPFQVWLPWASYFVGGVAFHEYPDVPVQAASHGCVRVPRYWAQQLYRFASFGTPVRVIVRST